MSNHIDVTTTRVIDKYPQFIRETLAGGGLDCRVDYVNPAVHPDRYVVITQDMVNPQIDLFHTVVVTRHEYDELPAPDFVALVRKRQMQRMIELMEWIKETHGIMPWTMGDED